MSTATIVKLPPQETASLPKRSYLNSEYGLKSWLLTGDHKRIAILYRSDYFLLHRRRDGRTDPP